MLSKYKGRYLKKNNKKHETQKPVTEINMTVFTEANGGVNYSSNLLG